MTYFVFVVVEPQGRSSHPCRNPPKTRTPKTFPLQPSYDGFAVGILPLLLGATRLLTRSANPDSPFCPSIIPFPLRCVLYRRISCDPPTLQTVRPLSPYHPTASLTLQGVDSTLNSSLSPRRYSSLVRIASWPRCRSPSLFPSAISLSLDFPTTSVFFPTVLSRGVGIAQVSPRRPEIGRGAANCARADLQLVEATTLLQLLRERTPQTLDLLCHQLADQTCKRYTSIR